MPIKRVDHLGRTFASSSCAGIAIHKKGLEEIPSVMGAELNETSSHDPYHLTPYEWAMFGDGLFGRIDEALLINLELKGASIYACVGRKEMHPFGSILHITVGRGDVEAVKWALAQNEKVKRHTPQNHWLIMCDANQRTPLHYIAMLTSYTFCSSRLSARPKLLDIAKLLIEALGANFAKELNRVDKLGLSPYLLAKKYCNTAILELFDTIAKSKKILITYKNLDPVLHYTEKERRFLEHEAAGDLQTFLACSASEDFLSTLPNPFGMRPLLIALKQNNLKEFNNHFCRFSYMHMELLQELDPFTGNTPFLLAAAYLDDLEEVFDWAWGTGELEQTNALGQNALHLAVTQLQVKNVEYLLRVLPKRCVWAADFLGRTPLHLVALLLPIELGYDYSRLNDFRSKQLEIVNLLQQAEASVDAHDNFYKSPLDYAIEAQASDSALAKALRPKEVAGVTSKVLSYCYGWWTRNQPALPESDSAPTAAKARPSHNLF